MSDIKDKDQSDPTKSIDTTVDKNIDETEVLESKKILEEDQKPTKKRSLKDIERIPGTVFLRSQVRKIFGIVFVIALMIVILNLSNEINKESERSLKANSQEIDPENPTNILSTTSFNHILLMILSAIVFLVILAFFTKLVFFDEREAFGIEKLLSIRSTLFFTLTIVFITQVFILFDIALVKFYLFTPVAYLVWNVHNNLFRIPFLSNVIIGQTDRKAYSDVRGFIFSIFLSFLIAFPLVLIVLIFARFSRRSIKKRERTWEAYKLKNWLIFISALPSEFILLVIYARLTRLNSQYDLQLILLPIILIIFLWWMSQLLMLTIRAIRLNSSTIGANLFIILISGFTFYLLPGFLWASWDILTVITRNSIDNTIYSTTTSNYAIDPLNVNLSSGNLLLKLYYQTFLLNLKDITRILELDFVFVVGLSSISIGFAEGYSLIAIFKGLYRGVSIAKSGRVASKSAPRGYVVFSNGVLFGAWLSLFWDKSLRLWNGIVLALNLPFPVFKFPTVFELIFDITIELSLLGGIFLALSILLLPTYFVVTSSFKFLSVSLVAERLKEDNRMFFFLISSAFILIVTNILAQITELPEFSSDGAQAPYLPLRGVATEQLLPFASNIFGSLESIGFSIGLIFTIFLGIIGFFRLLVRKILGRD